MKKLLTLTLCLIVLLALFCTAAQAEREPRDVKYYFLVSVTDCTSDFPVRRSCENSNGSIMMSTVRQDGSTGPTWSAGVGYRDWDHENATIWYYKGCEKGTTTKPTHLDESCAIDGFPTLIWLKGARTGDHSYGYIWNLNSTYTSTEKITLWVSSTGSSFVEVQSWQQTASASLDEFDEDMEVDEENLPAPTWIRGISGPSTIPIPQLNHADEKDHFYAEVDDQYGNQWRAGISTVIYDIAEPHMGLSMGTTSGILTTSPNAASLNSGVTSFRVLVRARWLKDILYPDKAVGMYVDFVYPKYLLTYYSEGTAIALYDAYYGTSWTHPADIPATKKNDNDNHYIFTGWESSPRTVQVTGNMNFNATYRAEAHSLMINGTYTCMYCPVCDRIVRDCTPADFLSGAGTSSSPYLIRDKDDWEHLCSYVAGGKSTSQKYFRLDSNISVTTMLGASGSGKAFSGIFDGAGHTLNCQISSDETYTAPFPSIQSATIKNLKVTGRINGTWKAACLVGQASGTTRIVNCRIGTSVVIDGTVFESTDVTVDSGIICNASGAVYITGCALSGWFYDGYYDTGSFWAKANGVQIHLKDCVDATHSNRPVGFGGVPSGSSTANVYWLGSNAEYSAWGKLGRAVTADDGIEIGFGTPTATYSVSGIVAYGTGLKYDGTFYAGAGDVLDLGLSCDNVPEGTIATAYVVDWHPLAGHGNTWTLTMPNADANIGALFIQVFGHADFTLPAFLTEVEEYAFEGAAMSSVEVPQNCTSIGAGAFKNCRSLDKIRIPANCAIGDGAFDGCGLVIVYGSKDSDAESYCSHHDNCYFVEE